MSTVSKVKNICIVGGVAGGASAAARLRRLDEFANIMMFEKGNYVSFANCGLPYYVGNVIEKESSLVVTAPSTFKSYFNIDVRVKHEVLSIDKENKTITVKDANTNHTYTQAYDYLVLAPGSKPIVPRLPGVNAPGVFILRDIPDSNQIKSWIADRQAKKAVIVGGGFIGLEMAENLKHQGLDVSIIEMAPHVLPILSTDLANYLQRQITKEGVHLYTNTGLKEIRTKEDDSLEMVCSDGQVINGDLALLSVGISPESQLAKQAGLELGMRNSIVVDSHMRTSDPAIFAAGDAVQTYDFITKKPTCLALAGPANRQARVIADNIAGIDSEFRGVQGTSICGAFGVAAAATGHSYESLKRQGYEDLANVACIQLHPGQHVGYYPGQKQIHLDVYFNLKSGLLLGAQAVGEEGVDKRIDVISTYIQKHSTIDELAQAELCYAPQFGAAKDPVNMAGFIGENVMHGLLPLSSWEYLKEKHDDIFYLEVRQKAISEKRPMPEFFNIPLGDLRDNLDKLPKDKYIDISCNVGLTAYYATRILLQRGYKARLLPGGWFTYSALDFHNDEKKN
ncbi:hypothetical protein WA158_004864 [Blastocystis sp. Blastoise]